MAPAGDAADPGPTPTPPPAAATAGPSGAAWIPFDPATGDWIEVAPGAPAAVPPDARRRGPGPTMWGILFAIDLAVLAFFFLLAALSAFLPALVPGAGGTPHPSDLRSALWAQVVFNTLTLGLIPFAWVAGTRVRAWEGAKRYLRLHSPGKGILQGILLGVATLAGLVLLGILLRLLHYDPPSEQADQIVRAVTLPLAAALALSAGLGEEVFFRGILQRRIGVVGQAVVFGLFHLSYGTPLQVAIPALLGLLYGFLVKRGASLWVPITAHFLFDFVQLSAQFWLPHAF